MAPGAARGRVPGGAPSPPEPEPLVELPEDVRRFSHARRAGIAEVAPGGRVRLDTIARWVQDVAWADVDDAGLRGLTLWLVRRTRFEVDRFPRIDERCRLTTCVTGVGRMWAERRTDLVVEGETAPVVRVACVWVHIDPARLLPSAIHAVETATWTGPSTRSIRARLRHPGPPQGGAHAGRWTFRAAELDIADHVNNAAYLTPLDDELHARGRTGEAGVDVEIEYRTPAQAGEMQWLAAGPMRWCVGPTGEVHASVALGEWPSPG